MKFFVSTYTEGFFGEGANGSKGLYLCDFNNETKVFSIIKSFPGTINPSFIKLSKNKRNLFVVSEKLPPSYISNFLVNKNGFILLNDSIKLDCRSCCYISYNDDNNFVAVANYGSGEVFTYSLNENNKYVSLTSSFKNSKTGPNVNRQEAPHMHSVRLIDALDVYVACDLGCDLISFYDYKKQGFFKKSSIKDIAVKPGYGPRHSANTKDGKYLFITCELENRVLVYEFIDGQYVLKQDVSSIPDDYSNDNTCADIHLSEDDRYVFVSNRGHDSIAQFELKNGLLQLIGFTKTNGKGPRNFAVTNNFIIVANQDSNNCAILEIKNGLLTGNTLAKRVFISPVCIEKFEEGE